MCGIVFSWTTQSSSRVIDWSTWWHTSRSNACKTWEYLFIASYADDPSSMKTKREQMILISNTCFYYVRSNLFRWGEIAEIGPLYRLRTSLRFSRICWWCRMSWWEIYTTLLIRSDRFRRKYLIAQTRERNNWSISADHHTKNEHVRFSATTIIAPALSNSPAKSGAEKMVTRRRSAKYS